jgi:hypothetical protein
VKRAAYLMSGVGIDFTSRNPFRSNRANSSTEINPVDPSVYATAWDMGAFPRNRCGTLSNGWLHTATISLDCISPTSTGPEVTSIFESGSQLKPAIKRKFSRSARLRSAIDTGLSPWSPEAIRNESRMPLHAESAAELPPQFVAGINAGSKSAAPASRNAHRKMALNAIGLVGRNVIGPRY